VEVEADDFAEDDDAGSAALAGEDDLQELAFELGRGFGDARGADDVAGDGGEAGEEEFVDFRADLGRGGVGFRGDGAGDDVDDEFAGLLDVAQGVFAVVGAVGGLERREGQKRTVGGLAPTPEKKLKGATLATPFSSTVETRATGRGTMRPVISL
jgi:hypothetical protein